MSKISVSVVKDDYEKVVDILHGGGFIEVESPAHLAENDFFDPKSDAEYWLQSSKFALEVLAPFAVPEKKGIGEKLGPSTRRIEPSVLEKTLRDFDYRKIIAELENLDKDRNTAKNAVSQHRRDLKAIEGWRGLPRIDSLETTWVVFAIGTVPVLRMEEFRVAVQALKHTELTVISESDKEIRLVLVYARDISADVRAILEAADFKHAEVEVTDHETVEDRIQRLHEMIERGENDRARVEEHIRSYADLIPKFQIVYDALSWKSEQDEAVRKSQATVETVNILGWAQSHRLPELRSALDSATSRYSLDEVPIGDDEDIPVVLRNGNLVTPFESVTEIYGAPQYTDPDPTALLAPFFIVYFGLSLTDAGYGALLALFALLALKFMKPSGGTRKILRLMVMGGIATCILGAVFGGWFGVVLDDLPDGVLKSAFLAIRLIDPVANPMGVLALAFVLGFIQMVVGNVIDAWWKVKQGFVKDGLMGSGMWALFLVILGFWVAVKAGALPESLSAPAQYALYAGLAGMVLTQGRDGKNIFAKIFKGVFSLYGLVGYLSDILSYSRLLALGLSTGIIAMVVNLVASLFAAMAPSWISWLIWIVVIVGGHLFNLAINVLGAFIHAGRLQFVEYFPKFLVGGGRKFKPLMRTSKYVTVSES